MDDGHEYLRKNPGMRFFFTMNRLRRAWTIAVPTGDLTKSQAITLITLCHLHGEREGPDAAQRPERTCIAASEFAPMTLSTLAKRLKQSMPAVSQRVAALEESGYVKRTQDEKDRRTVWISITKKGLDALDESHAVMEQQMETLLQRIGSEDVNAMLDMMERLAVSLENYTEHKKE